MRIDLGIDKKTGQEAWAEVIDPEDMSAKARRQVRNVIKGVRLNDDTRVEIEGGINDLLKATMISMVVEAWSFPLPISVETVEELPVRMYDKLIEATVPHFELANFSSRKKSSEDSSSESGTGSTPSSESNG